MYLALLINCTFTPFIVQNEGKSTNVAATVL